MSKGKSGIRYPLVFDNDEKKAMNLRVLQKTFPKQILDYSLVIPKCSVYQVNDSNEWEKIDIFGPLFVVSVSETPMPIIIILNAQSFIKHQNFHLVFNKPTTHIQTEDNKVFFKLLDPATTYCISTNSNDDAQKLIQALSLSNNNYLSDPTVKHLIHQFGSNRFEANALSKSLNLDN